MNITVLGLLANPDVNLKRMHQLHNVRFLLQKKHINMRGELSLRDVHDMMNAIGSVQSE